jgi:hypothetical protein
VRMVRLEADSDERNGRSSLQFVAAGG